MEKEVEEIIDYGEYTIEQKIEENFNSTSLAIFKVDYNKYGYQRFVNEKLEVEKVIASDSPLVLGIFPVAPIHTPAKYANHMMLKLTTPLVLDPKAQADAYLIMPIEIGVVRSSDGDIQIIDAFSVGQSKYALYGSPENGIVCRFYETRIYPEIPKVAPYKEAVLRAHFHNYSEKINTISRLVFPISGADLYYRKNEAYYNDIEVVLQEKLLQTFLEIDVTDAEWNAERTTLNQKFDSKYVMEMGF